MKKNILIISVLMLLASTLFSQTQIGDVLREKIIDNSNNNLGTVNVTMPRVGRGIVDLGDIDGDGVNDLAVGANIESNYGEVFILLMDTNGTYKSKTVLTNNQNGISGITTTGEFGRSIASLGDINGDGITDIAVGEYNRNIGGYNQGGVHIICLGESGVAVSQDIIDSQSGYLSGGLPLSNGDNFGNSIANIGDLDGNGYPDLAVGAQRNSPGKIFILFLDSTNSVSNYNIITSNSTNFTSLGYDDRFGSSLASIGDFNKDGTPDIAVGAFRDDDYYSNSGAVYLIYLNNNGSVKSYFKISNYSFSNNPIGQEDNFGQSVALLPDLYGDGQDDIMVGAYRYDSDRGAVFIINFDTNQTIISKKIITYPEVSNPSNFRFGQALCYYGDYNNDSYPEIISSTFNLNYLGALYFLSIKGNTQFNSLRDISNNNDFTIFPNPTKGEFTIDIQDYSKIKFIEILDITGKKLDRIYINRSSTVFNASSYKKGMYLIRLENSNNYSKTKKLIIN